jgi:predicted FMN-binding regulatory protein PaiB
VDIEIKVTRLFGKSQACQQYNEATRADVIAGLEAEGTERAAEMAQIIRSASAMG